ncbi:hypothetical protein OF364_01105 [Mycoplasma enhydrae]|uniref:hypothetical protein n=1 Tax=Mycoplasma enhydrae TaxID=2499220 RepID=UPI00197C67EA|nr:hypothetical protein [Mycoplasma enhydrae]MBN4089689.1 hypothetical protein [Mycoplasma enhydrae]MCV3753414.1 hypothetical protein [Mycoplasma enhydrae]
MNKKTKKILFNTIPFSILATTLISVPIIQLSGLFKEEAESKKYYLQNISFNSKREWESAIRAMTSVKELSKNQITYYSRNNNKSFNDLHELKQYLAKNIVTQEGTFYENLDYFTDKDNLNQDGSLSEKQLSKINFSNNDHEKLFFMGKDGYAYDNENDAKDSYSSINSFFKFKGKYYDSREKIIEEITNKVVEIEGLKKENKTESEQEFKIRKLLDYLKIESPKNVFRAPNGKIVSLKNDFSNLNSYENEKLISFIKNNHKTYVKNKQTNEIYTEEYFVDNILQKSHDYSSPIINIKPNTGKKKFLVDIHKDDPANLYGEYVLESSSNDILKFTEKDRWIEHKRIDNKQIINQSVTRKIVNNFISNLLKANNSYEIYNYFDKNPKADKNFISQNYADRLSALNYFKFRDDSQKLIYMLKKVQISEKENLYQKLQNISNFMIDGKNGDLFSGIVISYLSGLAYLAKYKAPIKTIVSFKKYFYKLFNEINESIKQVLGPEFYVNNQGKEINLIDIYNIKNVDFDFNTSYNFFVDTIANSRKAINAISVITFAINNVNTTNSLISFNDSMLFWKTENLKELEKYKKIYEEYSLVSKKDSSYIFNSKDNRYIENKTAVIHGKYKISLFNFIANNANNFNKIIKKTTRDLIQKLKTLLNEKNYNKQNEELKKFFVKHKKELNYIAKQNFSMNLDEEWKQDTGTWISTNRYSLEFLNNIYKQYKKWSAKKAYTNKFSIRTRAIYVINKTNTVFSIKAEQKEAKKIYEKPIQVKELASIFSETFNVFQNHASQYKDFSIDFDIQGLTSFMVKSIMGFLSILGPIFQIFAVFAEMFIDIIFQIIGKTIPSDYVFSDTGSSNIYIWDGGLTHSRFWNSHQTKTRSIKDCKPMEPIEIMPEFVNSSLYFNEKEYSSLEKDNLKKDLIDFSLNNIYNNNDEYIFKRVYSFEKNEKEKQIDFYQDSLEKLVNELIKNKKIDKYWSLGGYLRFLENDNLKWIGTFKELKKEYIKFIRDDLRPILVLQIPKLNGDIPEDQTAILENRQYGNILYDYKKIQKDLNSNKDLEKNYLIFDCNLKNSKGEFYYWNSLNDLEKKLETFRSKFNVHSKVSSEEQYLKLYNYKDLKKSYKYNVYTITNKLGEMKSFISFDDAIKFLKNDSYLGIYKETIKINIGKKYLFNGREFDSWDELIKYCETLGKEAIKNKKERTNA